MEDKLSVFLGMTERTEEQLHQSEKDLIPYFENGVNYYHGKGKYNAMFGKKHSEETKKLISERAKGRRRRTGLKHTENARNKMSVTRKNKGLKWYTDGVNNTISERCPDGWRTGRSPGIWGRSKK